MYFRHHFSFAADIQKADSIKTKSEKEIQKVVPAKPGSEVKIQKSTPSKAGRINKDAAKIANAVLPKVVYPTMTHHLGYEGNKFSITVRFNTDMDRSTVIAGGTVRFDFPKAANAPGQITWISDRNSNGYSSVIAGLISAFTTLTANSSLL